MAASSGRGEDPTAGDWTTVTRSGRSGHSGPAGRYPNTTAPPAPRRPAPTAVEVAKGFAGLEIDDGTRSRLDKYDIPVEVSGEGAPAPADGFGEAGLAEAVLRNIARCGYDSPTALQQYSIPIVLSGRDLMACAQTGSGKTAAFCLPMVNGLVASAAAGGGSGHDDREGYGFDDYNRAARPRALVLAPTRELAVQIHAEAKKFSHQTGIRVKVVYGGTSVIQQLRNMERGVDILVATPSRLVDMIEKSRVSLEAIKYLVMDEADRMLDMGFEPQIRKIVDGMGMPGKSVRQTMLFSSTFAPQIQRLASDFLSKYIFITVGRVDSSTDLITQKLEFVTNDEKRNYPLDRLQEETFCSTDGKPLEDDYVDAIMCSECSICHPRSAEGDESYLEKMISDDNLVGSGSSMAHASENQSVDLEQLNNFIQIFVKLLDYPSISIQMECGSLVRHAIKKAFLRSGIHLRDSRVQIDGRTITPDTLIIARFSNSTFNILPRIRGGRPSFISYTFGVQPLHEYLIELGDSLFEAVKFSDPPCQSIGADFFVSLGECGRAVYHWLFSLIEMSHAKVEGLKPFTVNDLAYCRDRCCIVFYSPGQFIDDMSKLIYRRNVLNIGTIMESYFRYSPSRLATHGTGIHEMDRSKSKLPNHLEVLVQFIKEMPKCNQQEDGLTAHWRSTFRLDPAGMSSGEKIGLIMSLDLHLKYLSASERKAFDKAMGNIESWRFAAKGVPAFNDILSFQFFDPNTKHMRVANYDFYSIVSLWLFGRNYLGHSYNQQMSLKVAEAMFNFLFIYLLPLVSRGIVRNLRSPALPAGVVNNSFTVKDLLNKK